MMYAADDTAHIMYSLLHKFFSAIALLSLAWVVSTPPEQVTWLAWVTLAQDAAAPFWALVVTVFLFVIDLTFTSIYTAPTCSRGSFSWNKFRFGAKQVAAPVELLSKDDTRLLP